MSVPDFDICPFCGKPAEVRVQFATKRVYVGCENGCAHMNEDIDARTMPADAFQAAFDAALQRLADKWNRRSGRPNACARKKPLTTEANLRYNVGEPDGTAIPEGDK